jgi:hypothetical protein
MVNVVINILFQSSIVTTVMLASKRQALFDAAADHQNVGLLAQARASYLNVNVAAKANIRARLGLTPNTGSRGAKLSSLAYPYAIILAWQANTWRVLELAGAERDFGHSADAAAALHEMIATTVNLLYRHRGIGQTDRACDDREGLVVIVS